MDTSRAFTLSVHQINLIFIPTIAVICFFFVTQQLNQSLNIKPATKEVSFESSDIVSSKLPGVQLNQPINAQPESYSVKMRERRIPMKAAISNITLGGAYTGSLSNESYQEILPSKITSTDVNPVSTFSVDVDTGGYTNIRRMINAGELPEPQHVRTEEIVNYFTYRYPKPKSKDKPFAVYSEVIPSPWNNNSHILQVGLKGYAEEVKNLPASNLVFLVDVSGSMNSYNKLPLVQQSLQLLTRYLRPQDRVSLVTYAGNTELLMSSTSGREKDYINAHIELLNAAGGTAGEAAIRLAYQQAQLGFIEGGNNRIVMMTDGDFNVGLNSVDELTKLVEKERKSGVYLTTVGFGAGNYRDDVMEQLADKGNGTYFYIDNIKEAKRLFERNLRSSLYTIANDVKVQIEFDPYLVKDYRLIGYENRSLKNEDFEDDRVDAGEIGQGHSVTALYEVTFTQAAKESQDVVNLATFHLRYKPDAQLNSELVSQPIVAALNHEWLPSDDILLATTAAGFAELLRGSQYIDKSFDYTALLQHAENIVGTYSLETDELKELINAAYKLKSGEE